MIDFIANHIILCSAILFFIIAAVFTFVEMSHAPFDPEEMEMSDSDDRQPTTEY